MKREELYRDKNECGTIVYNAAEADSVMDAMEKRIKDFEVNHKLWEAENDALRNRIKELEQALTMASDPALHPTCADCDKCQPKWISVNDRLPTSDTTQYLVYDEMTKKYGKSFFSLRFKCFQFDVTHWMPLPPPPTTEEK